MLVEKRIYYCLEKNFIRENDAIIFYKKLKEEIGNEEKFEEFFEYFESTWLAIEKNKNSKYEFEFRCIQNI